MSAISCGNKEGEGGGECGAKKDEFDDGNWAKASNI